jgi:hypothetical protein
MAPAGRLLKEENIGAVQALLFHLTCWHLGLRYIGGGVHGDWPTQDFGIVLWSRSVAGGEWQTQEHLTRMSTVPINSVVEATWNTGSWRWRHED